MRKLNIYMKNQLYDKKLNRQTYINNNVVIYVSEIKN